MISCKDVQEVIRLTSHSDKILAGCSVLGAVTLNVGFEGCFHLINIQYKVCSGEKKWEKLVRDK